MNPDVHASRDRTNLSEETLLKVCDVLGGMEAVLNMPVLDLGDREGLTGYIDFIQPSEVGAPIMSGLDKYNRPFFTLRIQYGPRPDMVYVETLFQRYVNDYVLWTTGSTRITMLNRLGSVDLERLRTLVETKRLRIESRLNPSLAIELRLV